MDLEHKFTFNDLICHISLFLFIKIDIEIEVNTFIIRKRNVNNFSVMLI